MSRLSICLFVLLRPTLVWATRPTEYRRRRYCVVSLFERSHSHNGILHNRLFAQKHVVGVSVRIYYRSQPYTGDMYNTVARNATVSNRFRRRPHSGAKPQVTRLTKPGFPPWAEPREGILRLQCRPIFLAPLTNINQLGVVEGRRTPAPGPNGWGTPRILPERGTATPPPGGGGPSPHRIRTGQQHCTRCRARNRNAPFGRLLIPRQPPPAHPHHGCQFTAPVGLGGRTSLLGTLPRFDR